MYSVIYNAKFTRKSLSFGTYISCQCPITNLRPGSHFCQQRQNSGANTDKNLDFKGQNQHILGMQTISSTVEKSNGRVIYVDEMNE